MKKELIKLWKEYVKELEAHSESLESHRNGWVGHVLSFAGFMSWLEKGYIECN